MYWNYQTDEAAIPEVLLRFQAQYASAELKI